MDFGIMGLDGFVCSDSSFASTLASDPETKQNWYRSTQCLKQERSGTTTTTTTTEDEWRDLKVVKTSDDFSVSKAMLLQQKSPLLRSNTSVLSDGQMLSFSSPNSQTVATFPYYQQTPSAYARNTGYGSGGLNAASMQGVITGFKGPFTPSQWMELEQQALIYKYITANVPIPSNLLIPIKNALVSTGLSSFSGLRSQNWGWGSFHLGFSNTNDPEPGRCRRTDGKKWRCSRDAVSDQKYCERHMNRGRHRSRKPVEGQIGHSASGPAKTTTAKLMAMASSTSTSVVAGGGTSSGLGLSHHHQFSNLQAGATNPSPSLNLSRSFQNKESVGNKMQEPAGLSILPPAISRKESQYSLVKQSNLCEEPLAAEFGLVSTDSLLNPLNKSFSLINSINYGSSEDRNAREAKSPCSIRQFMDDWPKTQSESSTFSWPCSDLQSDRTELSISIPKAHSDFMSATSSPTKGKLAVSPLRLSCELEPIQRGLGMNTIRSEPNQRQASWIPISWETSIGGPLGEVLHSTNNSSSDCNNASVLNLMTEGWDSSLSLASSPTDVLQKATFRSFSNSSAGSSPRTENNKTPEGGSLCKGILSSTLVNHSLPPL